jgi:hypothetical protein
MNTPPSQSSLYSASYLREFQQVILQKSQNFVGRQFVFTAVNDFIHRHNRGYFSILDTPGGGKSAILAKYVIDNPDTIYYNAQIADKNHPDKFLENICTQLMCRGGNGYEILPDNATKGSWFLSLLLQTISDQLEPNQRLIIIIDALDSIDLNSQPIGSNVFYLPRYLPQGVYFILSSRPYLRKKYSLLIETPSQVLDLAAYPEENLKDVRAYIQRYLTSLPYLCWWREESSLLGDRNISEDDFVARLAAKSENNFMYLSQILLAITEGLYPKEFVEKLHITPIPSALEAYYQQHWQKIIGQGLTNVELEVLCVLASEQVGKGISAKSLAKFLGEDEYDVQEVLENCFEFLQQLRVGEEICYSFYHSSFRDWLRYSHKIMDLKKC